MAKSIFRPDSPLMITMTQITDVIFLSLFWLLGCVPVITIGVSSAALYDAVYQGFRKGAKHPWQRFARSFKQNLLEGLLPGVFYFGVFTLGAWLLIQVWNGAVYGTISWAVFSGAAFLAVLVLGILGVLFPLMSRFDNGFLQMVKNTLLLGIVNLPRTLALGVLTAVSMFLCVRYIFPLFFLPALTALISTLLLEHMFKPYMPKEETEEIPEAAAE